MKKGLLLTFLFSIYHVCAFAQTSEVISINNRNHAMLIIANIGTMMDQGTQTLVSKLRTKDSVNFNNLYKHIRFMINNSYQYSSINEKVKKVGSEMYLQQYQALFMRILLTTKVIELNADTLRLYFDEEDTLTDFSISLNRKSKINVNHTHIMPTEIHRQDFEQQGLLLTITEK
jgi:hypothetical protein